MKILAKVEKKINRIVYVMAMNFAEVVKGAVEDAAPSRLWGRVSAIDGGIIHVAGLVGAARIGDRIRMGGESESSGEVIAINDKHVLAMPDATINGMSPGDRAYLYPNEAARPCHAWIGEVLSSDGLFLDGRPTPKGERAMVLNPQSLAAAHRRGLGTRLKTGLAPLDTFLPLCRGQRVGLFAGAGVGKSSMIGDLAQGVSADIVIIALIGERSREVREFVNENLNNDGGGRAIIFASTCDEPAPSKKRCAFQAIAAAEYFRDQGLHVLVLFDSITRFADAHREVALTAGETPSLRAYPPSTFRAIAAIAERTGPGSGHAGDITAIFSVLVAGSDMDEPIADMVRSILDGHIILDRDIAERGRFPAINVRRSVSRSLPKAATEEENALIGEGRRLIAAYDDAATLIQTGLYAAGADPIVDRAVALWPELDGFIVEKTDSCEESFEKLRAILEQDRQASTDKSVG